VRPIAGEDALPLQASCGGGRRALSVAAYNGVDFGGFGADMRGNVVECGIFNASEGNRAQHSRPTEVTSATSGFDSAGG